MQPIQPVESTSSLSFRYTAESLDTLARDQGLLAVINFGKECFVDHASGYLHCGLPSLNDLPLTEVWRSDLPVRRGVCGPCHWSETDELLVVALSFDETPYPDFRMAVKDAYQRLIQFTFDKAYPHIIRMWNFIADINQGEGDAERYKQFCDGRYEALLQRGFVQEQFAAACALGHAGTGNIIYLLAAKTKGLNFKNPRQMNAYHYPREYGPSAPSFARATLATWQSQRQLFVSGTASIIGHQSMYASDFDAQFEVTCQNIDSLLQHVAEQLGECRVPRMSLLKVYLRDKRTLDTTRDKIDRHFGGGVPVVFLLGDICRRELLIEIDGLCVL